MDKMIDELYGKFVGLPSSKPIVRNGIRNDAFELVVLKILYEKLLDIKFEKDYVDTIAKYIIAPPDEGIDIFVEKENGDESFFDVIQVKYAALSESELKTAINNMKRTISDFCKSPLNVSSTTCREILSNSGLEKNNKGNCRYYIVHIGDTREYNGIRDDEHILNLIDLKVLSEGQQDRVEEDVLSVGEAGNYLQYGDKEASQNAVICNICAFDLAMLNNKYYSTEIGRNILFGHNLREALNPKTSKSYGVMKKTIETCPDNFWYYNNGITIIAESVEPTCVGEAISIKLEKFSIVNGAQTTSSLGLILQQAKRDRDISIEASLKKAYVMARILKVSDDNTKNAIAIYNNTQNPINNRDMVANNIEQKKLHDWMIDATYPQIFVENRRGDKLPSSFNKLFAHRSTSNETLAQLVYAGFFLQPFIAKDKKAALFYNDTSQNKYTMNEIYHKVFHYAGEGLDENGIIFKKKKHEIDELLFAQQLYKDGKTYLRKIIQERLEQEKLSYEAADNDGKASILPRIERDESMLETIGVCQFYFIACYYELLAQNVGLCADKRYDFERYYQDKAYKGSFVADVSNFFLMKTVEILNRNAKEYGKAANMNNWVRGAACQNAFLDTIRSDIGYDMSLQTKYEEFIMKYKVVPL